MDNCQPWALLTTLFNYGMLYKGDIMKKKIFCLVFLMTIAFAFSGCIITIESYRIDNIPSEKVESIDLYDLTSFGYYDYRGSGFHEKTEPVYRLKEDKIDDFLNGLKKIKFESKIVFPAANDPSFSYGNLTIRINFVDGSFMFISNYGFGEIYDKNGEVVTSSFAGCNDDKWEKLIESVVPSSVYNREA